MRPPLLCRGEEQALLGDHEDHPGEEGSQAEDGHHGHLRRSGPGAGDPQHHRSLTSLLGETEAFHYYLQGESKKTGISKSMYIALRAIKIK